MAQRKSNTGFPCYPKVPMKAFVSQNGIEPRHNYFRTQMHKINQYKAQMFTDTVQRYGN